MQWGIAVEPPGQLNQLKLYAERLKLVKVIQLLLFFVWMFALAAYILKAVTGHPHGLLLAVTAAVAPILVAVLVVVQIFWAGAAKRPYEETGRLLVLGDLRPELRLRAKDALSEFQIQAKPLFVRGRASESLALALFVFGLILSFGVVLFLR